MLQEPPIQQNIAGQLLNQPWVLWFKTIVTNFNSLDDRFSDIEAGMSGFGTDGVIDGGRRTTGTALFDGGRRV